MKYFPSHLVKQNNISLPIIKHSDQAQEPSFLVLSRIVNLGFDNIIQKIETGLIKGIISNSTCLKLFNKYQEKVELIECENPNLFWAELCFKNYPIMPKNRIAVTGTNGKSSTTWFIYQLLKSMKQNVLLINSSGIFENEEKIAENINTTPDAKIIHENATKFAGKFGENSFMIIETSSIGIDQHRTAFIKPQVGIWTNFSHEHLDYHKTMENYFAAKMKLASECEKYFINECIEIEKYSNDATPLNVRRYGKELIFVKQDEKLEMQFNFHAQTFKISCNMFGEFQAKNILSAIIVLQEFFAIESLIAQANSLQAPAGRMQLITAKNGRKIFIDNSHKAEALRNVLQELRKEANKTMDAKLFVIAGCGGNRDKEKRPIMGSIMQQLADFAIITNDNPRHEDPAIIAQEMLNGCLADNLPKIILDRKEAITHALKLMKANDILLIAGKGEETEQIIGEKLIEWNDYQAVQEILSNEKINQLT